jgi:Ca2+:H+ antiporter
MGPVVFLVEQLARPIDYIIETLHAPTAFGGVVMAILVATPEAISAVRASIANNLQRSVNIFLGSVLSTIGLTVPAMLVVSQLYGHPVTLGLEHGDLVMLLLTLAVSIITFASGRTHLMQGAVHLVLFLAYVLLIFQQ